MRDWRVVVLPVVGPPLVVFVAEEDDGRPPVAGRSIRSRLDKKTAMETAKRLNAALKTGGGK